MQVHKHPKIIIKTKTQSCFSVQRNKNPEEINFINKPTLALVNLKRKTKAQKKT